MLDREDWFAVDADAFEGAVKEGAVGLDDARWQTVGFDDEAVVLRGDLDLGGLEIFYRMVGAPVAVVHFFGGCAEGQGQHLVAEADAEDW